jgi:hypothetical protein
MSVFQRVHMPPLDGATELRGHVVLVELAFAFG